jgi:hypothetical protein
MWLGNHTAERKTSRSIVHHIPIRYRLYMYKLQSILPLIFHLICLQCAQECVGFKVHLLEVLAGIDHPKRWATLTSQQYGALTSPHIWTWKQCYDERAKETSYFCMYNPNENWRQSHSLYNQEKYTHTT